MIMRIITADQAAELDQKAMHDHGISGIELMGSAGQAIADEAREMVAEIHDPKIIIICGKGNNGGDGFAAAACLDGFNVYIYSLIEAKQIVGDAAHFHENCIQKSIDIYYAVDPPEDLSCDLIIDAVLGTGCKGDLKEKISVWTQWMNSHFCPVLAVDCPTGVDGSRGSASENSVQADNTITMGYPKLGLCIKHGKEYSGEIKSVDIGFPDIVGELSGLHWSQFEAASISKMLSKVESDTYKHRQGKVLVVAGSKGMTGAAVLSTFGALRSGAGVTVTCAPESIEEIYEKTIIEGMTIGCQDDGNGFFIPESYKSIEEKFDWCDAIVIGPGIGRSAQTSQLLENVILAASKPLVIDADGLRVFHGNRELFNDIKVPFIITPHEGEFCKLLGIDLNQFNDDYPDNIEQFMSGFPSALILKNAPTISFYQNSAIVNPSGNPGMATAGMGDVLAGMLGTFLAQGMDVFQAAQAGVFIHGLAADRKVDEKGIRGLIASDVLEELPKVMREFD
jgi:NAD(P)H-hydrate epimerase